MVGLKALGSFLTRTSLRQHNRSTFGSHGSLQSARQESRWLHLSRGVQCSIRWWWRLWWLHGASGDRRLWRLLDRWLYDRRNHLCRSSHVLCTGSTGSVLLDGVLCASSTGSVLCSTSSGSDLCSTTSCDNRRRSASVCSRSTSCAKLFGPSHDVRSTSSDDLCCTNMSCQPLPQWSPILRRLLRSIRTRRRSPSQVRRRLPRRRPQRRLQRRRRAAA